MFEYLLATYVTYIIKIWASILSSALGLDLQTATEHYRGKLWGHVSSFVGSYGVEFGFIVEREK